MIRIPRGDEVISLNESELNILDQLVDSLIESYGVSSSHSNVLRSGLVNTVSSYVSEFISNNSNLVQEDVMIDIRSGIDLITESINCNPSVVVSDGDTKLVKFINSSNSIEYQFLDMDISEIPSGTLIETWNCKNAAELAPLLEYITLGKES